MKINKAHLKEVIHEETQNLLIEQQLSLMIDEECAKLGIVLTEEEKRGIMRRLGKAARGKLAPLAVGAALAAGGAGIADMQADYKDAIQSQIAQNMASAAEYSTTPEAKIKNVKNQLDNTAAWLWSMSDDPRAMGYLPTTDTGAGVLPPEWSVMKQVYDDVSAGNAPLFSLEDIVPASGDSEQSRTNFAQDFAGTDFEGWGGSKGIMGTIYVDFDDLPEDYSMPLSGKSPSEYYVQMWDQYVGY